MNYYFAKGYTPIYKTTVFNLATTVAIWTPTTSMRIALTGMTVASNLGGTFLVTFGNLAGSKVMEFNMGASSTISPTFGPIVSNTYDRVLFGRPSEGATNTSWVVTTTGFEID